MKFVFFFSNLTEFSFSMLYLIRVYENEKNSGKQINNEMERKCEWYNQYFKRIWTYIMIKNSL